MKLFTIRARRNVCSNRDKNPKCKHNSRDFTNTRVDAMRIGFCFCLFLRHPWTFVHTHTFAVSTKLLSTQIVAHTIYGFACSVRQFRLSFVEATISMALPHTVCTVFYTYLVKCDRILFVYFTSICTIFALSWYFWERGRRPTYGHTHMHICTYKQINIWNDLTRLHILYQLSPMN